MLIECDEFRIWVFDDVHRRLLANSIKTIGQKKKKQPKQQQKCREKKTRIKRRINAILVSIIHLCGSNKNCAH